MKFTKLISALCLAFLVGIAFGQTPKNSDKATKIAKLHQERIEVYSEMLKLAHAKGSLGHEQQRELLLVKLDAATTPKEKIELGKEIVELCRKYEQLLRVTRPDDYGPLLDARSERIEAEILVEQLLGNG